MSVSQSSPNRSWEVWTEAGTNHLMNDWGAPSNPRVNARHTKLIRVVADQIGRETVLDVCCGMGHLYHFIADKVKHYLGIDNSLPMIEVAWDAFDPDRELFQVYDVFDLSSLDMFDTVVNISLIQHLPSQYIQPVIEQMWSRTKKRFIIEAPIAPYMFEDGRRVFYAPTKTLIDRPIEEKFLMDIFRGLPDFDTVSSLSFHERYTSTIYVAVRDAESS